MPPSYEVCARRSPQPRRPDRAPAGSRARAARRPASSPAAQLQRDAERGAVRPQVSVRSIGPAATTRPPRSSSTWVKPGGISSTWWVTSTSAGASGSAAMQAEPAHEVLATPEVEPGGRLVEQHQLRVGHQGARDLHPLALALREGAEPPLGEVGHAEAVEQLVGARRVELRRSARASAPPRRTTRSAPRRARSRAPGSRSARAALDSPMRGRSSNTSTAPSVSPSTTATPRVGCRLADATCSSVVLPAPFGPEHHPPLALAPVPVDRVEQRRAVPDHAHAGEVQHVGHARQPIQAACDLP